MPSRSSSRAPRRASSLPVSADVWPTPQTFTQGSSPVSLTASFAFSATGGFAPAPLPEAFARYTNLIFFAGTPSSGPAPFPVLAGCSVTVGANATLEVGMDESYSIQVSTAGCQISAATQWGALRALESFSQLVTWTGAATMAPTYAILNTTISIQDAPRYRWRGILIDTSRHYLEMSAILHVIDTMSAAKFNVLHVHFVDDNSWPLVVEAYPNFSAMGAYSPAQVYTHDDVIAIQQACFARGIVLIPEFDMPAHASIWGAGYPDLTISCADGQTLLDPTGPVYTVLDNILTEFQSIFTAPYLHLGGDEVEDLTCWNESAKVQAFNQAHGIANVTGTRNYFETQVQNVAAKHNKTTIFWEEVFDGNFTLLPTTVVNVWLSQQESLQAAQAGHDVVHSYGWYLDQQSTLAPCARAPDSLLISTIAS